MIDEKLTLVIVTAFSRRDVFASIKSNWSSTAAPTLYMVGGLSFGDDFTTLLPRGCNTSPPPPPKEENG